MDTSKFSKKIICEIIITNSNNYNIGLKKNYSFLLKYKLPRFTLKSA